MLEEMPGSERQTSSRGPGDDLDGEDGVATHLKEVVMDAHLWQTEYLRPDAGQYLLIGSVRRGVRLLEVGTTAVGRGQGAAVEFAVGSQGQSFQWHEGRREHIIWQAALQMAAQITDRESRLRVQYQIGDQTFVAGLVLAQRDGCLLDGRVLRQHGLDFGEFDAEATQLDLLIASSQELDSAIGPVASQIARFVETSAGLLAERMGDKAFSCQSRIMEIAAS